MALGVLNNLSAIYAENNLNNTNSSLQKVLQQLSSGSRINSGADDAAGLSLVNGLGANSTALTQSGTNATEGVGLLQVADGALSQVTNLLNRAITLATEASNGTLNSTQTAAANQEYQSIMAEINNIGSTTTYNQQTVFSGNTIAIYTGDSSSQGSSINNLYIRQLSSSSLGDTAGKMSYSNGQNNVFLDLSTSTKNAATTDSLSGTSTSINVNYLTKGASGAPVTASATITVGSGTNYSNTVQGMISAINASGLGLTATFGTAAQAGTASTSADLATTTGTDTGIIISGQSVGTGTTAGVVGELSVTGGVSASSDALSGTLQVGTKSIILGTAGSTDTLANLATTINAGSYGVTAQLSGSTLTFISADASMSISGTSLSDSTSGTEFGKLTLGAGGSPTLDTLSGNFEVMDSSGVTHSFALAAGHDTLNTLATYITAQGWGITATTSGNSMVLTSNNTGSAASFNASDITGITDTTTPAATLTATSGPGQLQLTNVPTSLSNMDTVARTLGKLTIGGLGAAGNALSGTFNVTGADGITHAYTLSGANNNNSLSLLATYLNSQNIGVIASVSGSTLTLSSTSADSQASFTSADISGVVDATPGSTLTVSGVELPPVAYFSTAISAPLGITDSSTSGGTSNVAMITNTNGTTGIATTSYTDSAGENLSATDLLSQGDAQSALTKLNTAISDVASQDGYIGAEINTLNSISQVMSTQQTNVLSAQNAIQATDYASATSAMSKYEILSQTGIAALAQANSVQQEVTKLLQ